MGVNRRPTPWDRENLAMWKSWNFTEDMILEASKLSSGKASPIAYVNGILSNWKNSGIFTPEAITEKPSTPAVITQEEYNKEYAKRRNLAVSRAQKNTEKAMSIEGVATILSRLNSIEKDLAFAEIANDNEKLDILEKEKSDLLTNVEKTLKQNGLSLRALSPVYACEKCKDTGYVGTHRCDCFDKK
jgi:DnaD/phage-associated family protein